MVETVLCYIEKDNQYLMLLRNKKKHDMNANKYIGVGGHIEINESKEEALLREVKEETGLTLLSYIYRGKLLFQNDDFIEVMYLYTSKYFKGEITSCDEGELHFIDKDKILDLPLWEGDRYFLPLLINSDEFIKLKLIYSQDKLVKVEEWKDEIR